MGYSRCFLKDKHLHLLPGPNLLLVEDKRLNLLMELTLCQLPEDSPWEFRLWLLLEDPPRILCLCSCLGFLKWLVYLDMLLEKTSQRNFQER